MSKVSIKVGPKTYTFNTAEGDEQRITALGKLVDEKYQMLGHSRSVQETENLVFAALFLADELDEARKSAGSTVDLGAEIETLRKAEERAREENRKLKAEIAELREAARQQHDLFGGDEPDDDFAARQEALADRAEQAAAALERGALEGGPSAD